MSGVRMLSRAEVDAAIRDLESASVERKAKKSEKSDIEEAICAFSNDLPGTGRTGIILIGVTDRTGEHSGLIVTDELLRELTNIRSDGNILPFPIMQVYKTSFLPEADGREIVVIEVTPSGSPPVRLRGSTRVRVGPRKGIATRDEERILTERRRSKELSFDQHPVYGASIEDLNLAMFQRDLLPAMVDAEVLRENGRSVPEQLASLHLANPDAIPTVAGVLTLAHSPKGWLPGAYVQFVRFDAAEMDADRIVDQRDLQGSVPDILRAIDEMLRANIRIKTTVSEETLERRQPDYPIKALQQLLRNAVMHKNYETSHAPVQWYWFTDRIEIHNPGGLYGRAVRERLGEIGGNDYRNPTLAGVLKRLGFVQQFGMGIQMARKECMQNGNPAPEFDISPSNFAVKIYLSR